MTDTGFDKEKIVNCKFCNKEMSIYASACPKCGHPRQISFDIEEAHNLQKSKIISDINNEIADTLYKKFGAVAVAIAILGFFAINALIENVVSNKINDEINRYDQKVWNSVLENYKKSEFLLSKSKEIHNEVQNKKIELSELIQQTETKVNDEFSKFSEKMFQTNNEIQRLEANLQNLRKLASDPKARKYNLTVIVENYIEKYEKINADMNKINVTAYFQRAHLKQKELSLDVPKDIPTELLEELRKTFLKFETPQSKLLIRKSLEIPKEHTLATIYATLPCEICTWPHGHDHEGPERTEADNGDTI